LISDRAAVAFSPSEHVYVALGIRHC